MHLKTLTHESSFGILNKHNTRKEIEENTQGVHTTNIFVWQVAMERLLLEQQAQRASLEAALAKANLEQFDARDWVEKDVALEKAKRKIAELEHAVMELTPKPKKKKFKRLSHASDHSLAAFGITVTKRAIDPATQAVIFRDETSKLRKQIDVSRNALRYECSEAGCDCIFSDKKGLANHMRRHSQKMPRRTE